MAQCAVAEGDNSRELLMAIDTLAASLSSEALIALSIAATSVIRL